MLTYPNQPLPCPKTPPQLYATHCPDYKPQSGSDCEVLLPLYQKYGATPDTVERVVEAAPEEKERTNGSRERERKGGCAGRERTRASREGGELRIIPNGYKSSRSFSFIVRWIAGVLAETFALLCSLSPNVFFVLRSVVRLNRALPSGDSC